MDRFIQVGVAQYEALLPPGYRMLKMESFHCSGMHVFLRSKLDESAEQWAETIEYAVRILQRNESQSRYIKSSGCPVIVAFQRKLKVFYYVHKRVDPPPQVKESIPQCKRIAASCMDPDPRRRLIELDSRGPIINLDHRESREEFEKLIRCFCGAAAEFSEWDPFTGGFVRLVNTLDESR